MTFERSPATSKNALSGASDDSPVDPREAVFLSPCIPDLFHAFAYSSDVWKADPFDVESIHSAARHWFDRAVVRVLESPRLSAGRILLLLGESGSGKTHLMRAFRNRVHSSQRGYCGYMQMTAYTGQYGRYVLNNLIESLDRPYHEPESIETGLMRISNALTSSLDDSFGAELDQVREGELDQSTLDRLVGDLADRVILDARLADVDVYLIQALLYLQANDPRIKARVLKYLRCEDLTPHDRRLLGGIVPCTYLDAPHWVIQRLGQLIWAVERVPLILCVDQLEDVFDLEEAAVKFRKAMATLCDLVSRLPSIIVVISCLENFYDELKKLLTMPIKDRVENDPRPVSLHTPCDRGEVERLIALRLKYLFGKRGVPHQDSEPTFPLPELLVRRLVGLRAREVLLQCQVYRDRCIEEGKMADYPLQGNGYSEGAMVLQAERNVTELEAAWNDFRAGVAPIVPSDEAELATVLGRAIRDCSGELEAGLSFQAETTGRFVQVQRRTSGAAGERLAVAVCNKSAQGGWLGRQIEELIHRAGDARAVAVRSSAYPFGGKTAIAQMLRDLVESGGRRVVVEDSDWRAMMALAGFKDRHEKSPDFMTWQRQTRPLITLGSLRSILGLNDRA
jgi:hypothetical protein